MSAQDVEKILEEVKQLSPTDQLHLIKHVAETLAASTGGVERGPLVYGKYRDSGCGRMSTDEDFESAKWLPTEKDLNGP